MNDVIDLIDSRKPGVTELDISIAEEAMDVAFPNQYKELFKLSNNAQIGEWTLFPIKDPKNLKRTWDDIVRQNKDVKDEELPNELITIGEDGTGDKLCFRIVNRVIDSKVYIWYHETREFEELASNLKEFIISYSEELDEDV
ncbi:SMI1/KNR4 family protein [Peribacillus frigoritolerans]|uniref:SMI1/KNR4 family protein n=1 Tax=Peribacillus frigoritolerans TaxID=450367 RepID=UPI0010597EA8|nr:SMI1/KNR4 family protein [Peribacillus frigoritolerans]TDL76099.1 SMI1/KNR4 family protein [Peribacillus frigoritolerans]